MENKLNISTDSVRSGPPANILVDKFGRNFNYLRIAVNEICNLRCIYCMPEQGLDFKSPAHLLQVEEIIRILKISTELGVNKIRFTGGEPLLYPQLPQLINAAVSMGPINSVNLTTNGIFLDQRAASLKKAGLAGLNISLDTLQDKKFRQITRRNELSRVLNGLEAAKSLHFSSLKINIVVLKGFNDDELFNFVELTRDYPLTVRFIELMPFDSHQIWKTGKFLSGDHILKELKHKYPVLEKAIGTRTEYNIFQIPKYEGKVAIIPAFSRTICRLCNRLRITADGKIRNCLFAHNEIDILQHMRQGGTDLEISALLRSAMWNKHENGWEAQKTGRELRPSMAQIGG